MSSITSIKLMLALSCVLAATCLLNLREVSASPVKDDKPEPLSPDFFSDFPVVVDCKNDEEPRPGHLPECEPTCDNPKPACRKIFTQLDFVPCFCKAPLVRHVQSKKCVQLDECPCDKSPK